MNSGREGKGLRRGLAVVEADETQQREQAVACAGGCGEQDDGIGGVHSPNKLGEGQSPLQLRRIIRL